MKAGRYVDYPRIITRLFLTGFMAFLGYKIYLISGNTILSILTGISGAVCVLLSELVGRWLGTTARLQPDDLLVGEFVISYGSAFLVIERPDLLLRGIIARFILLFTCFGKIVELLFLFDHPMMKQSESIMGILYITNQRLVFCSCIGNASQCRTFVFLSEVKDCSYCSFFGGLKQYLTIITPTCEVVFVVKNAKYWVSVITAALSGKEKGKKKGTA